MLDLSKIPQNSTIQIVISPESAYLYGLGQAIMELSKNTVTTGSTYNKYGREESKEVIKQIHDQAMKMLNK